MSLLYVYQQGEPSRSPTPEIEAWVGLMMLRDKQRRTNRTELLRMGQAMCGDLAGAELFLRHQVSILPASGVRTWWRTCGR